jgi:hypothetical protein
VAVEVVAHEPSQIQTPEQPDAEHPPAPGLEVLAQERAGKGKNDSCADENENAFHRPKLSQRRMDPQWLN